MAINIDNMLEAAKKYETQASDAMKDVLDDEKNISPTKLLNAQFMTNKMSLVSELLSSTTSALNTACQSPARGVK